MPRPTLLVVEDEILLRLDMADLAQRAGFATQEAANAAEALEILESDASVSVVVTDINMPGELNGLALASTVRERWPPTIIVVCSGNPEPDRDELPSEAIFMAKPCNGPRLEDFLGGIFRSATRGEKLPAAPGVGV